MDQILSLLPSQYTRQLSTLPVSGIQELRMASNAPLIVRTSQEEFLLWPRSTSQQLEELLRAACEQSIYAHTESLREGYITLSHGHRIGICGFGVKKMGDVITVRSPTSILIRNAHPITGCAAGLINRITSSAIIIGPPCSGKTTLLRDLVRLLSDVKKARIGIADERGELAACRNGSPCLDVGMRTDILTNVPKAKAIMMLVRTMSPEWIAVDEITSPEDVSAMEQACFCGVNLLATAHSARLQDLYHRPLYKALMKLEIFKYVITMKMDKSFTVEEVIS